MSREGGYQQMAGVTYPDEKHAGGEMPVIQVQPAAVSGIENYVIDLDANQVASWSAEDVVEQFVNRIGCSYASELFLANKITGKSLMMLREDHLKEMGVSAIGDRVYMLEMIGMLKKKKIEQQTTATLWSAETPADGCAYNKNCWHCIRRYTCPCCVSRTYWKVTGQGVFYRKVPPCREHFGTVSTEFMDYRFFKDLELKEEHACCCFCQRYKLQLFVDDKDSSGAERVTEGFSVPLPHELMHPDAPTAEKIIRNAWNQANLVAL